MPQVLNNVQTQFLTQTQTRQLTETVPQLQYFTNTVTTHIPVYRTVTIAGAAPVAPPVQTFTLTSTVFQQCNVQSQPQGYVLK